MNRRELIQRGPLALLGAVAVAAGVKAQPRKDEPIRVVASVSVPMDESQIVRIIKDDYMRGGELREVIQHGGEWGPLTRSIR